MQFREVLLIDVEEFSYQETSEILAIPVSTVTSRLDRARSLLQEPSNMYAARA